MRSLGWADYLKVEMSNDRKTLTLTYWLYVAYWCMSIVLTRALQSQAATSAYESVKCSQNTSLRRHTNNIHHTDSTSPAITVTAVHYILPSFTKPTIPVPVITGFPTTITIPFAIAKPGHLFLPAITVPTTVRSFAACAL